MKKVKLTKSLKLINTLSLKDYEVPTTVLDRILRPEDIQLLEKKLKEKQNVSGNRQK